MNCWSILPQIKEEEKERISLRDKLEEQITINLAAAHVARRLVDRDGNSDESLPGEILSSLDATIRSRRLVDLEAMPLFSAEFWGFLHLRGDPNAAVRLAALRMRHQHWTLGLDAAVFGAITHEFVESPPDQKRA